MINGKRIIKVDKYLTDYDLNEELYISISLDDKDKEILSKYGFDQSSLEDKMIIPNPINKSTTENVDGKWIVHKNLPKEKRTIERDYHIVDWHGNNHDGTCYQEVLCYQRTLIEPKEIGFNIENNIMYSALYVNNEENRDNIKCAINIILSILGRCEILNKNKINKYKLINEKKVSWTILPKGDMCKSLLEDYIEKTTLTIPKSKRQLIKNRFQFLRDLKYDFCVTGSQSFYGYIVFCFSNKNIYLFESNKPDNATYVFEGNWEEASKLTKSEILTGNLHKCRIFHTHNWKSNIINLLKVNE